MTLHDKRTRNHSLDAARGILMILGIVLHTANVYAVGSNWLITDPGKHPVFGVLVSAIHVFRMPTFFWISGYFCALTFERGGSKSLLTKRLPRLAVPLLATWLTFNVLQEIVVAAARGYDIRTAVSDGVPLFHLWFLLDLLIYVSFAALVLPWLSRVAPSSGKSWDIPLPLLLVALSLATMLVSASVRATGVAYVAPFGMTSLYRLAGNMPYFAGGILMYALPDVRKRFLATPILLLLPAIPLALHAIPFEKGSGLVLGEFALLVKVLMTWVCIGALLNGFHTVFFKDSSLTRFLSETSYSIFLFHHLFVVSLGIAFVDFNLTPWIKFLTICTITLIATTSLHTLLVRRIGVLGFAFNGKSHLMQKT
ncbi:MAG: acyltransferase family protein [Rhodoferax sp.]|nr:acyltransferase family protein [Rhodoferax sp.]